MPIRGMTDEDGVLPSLGWIKMGLRVPTKVQGELRPKATEYFVSPPEVVAVYGETPTELDIVLRGKTDEDVFPHYLKYKGPGGGLICKGDGRTASRLNKISGEWDEGIACDKETCPIFVKGDCGPDGILHFAMHRVAGLGVWRLDVGRKRSIKNILLGLKLLRAAAGRIDDIPMRLKIRMEPAPYRDKAGKMQHKKGAILYLFPKQSQDELMAMRDGELEGTDRIGMVGEQEEDASLVALKIVADSIFEAAKIVGFNEFCNEVLAMAVRLPSEDAAVRLRMWLQDEDRTEMELNDVLIMAQEKVKEKRAG